MAFIGMNAANAWVSFNSNNSIRDSYNVSSVARFSTGNFAVNLSITLPSTDYVVVSGASNGTNSNAVYLGSGWPSSTTQFYHATHWTNGTAYDRTHNYSAVFGDRY